MKTIPVLLSTFLMLSVMASARASGNNMDTSLNAGATYTDGNSETMLINISLLTEGSRERLGSVRAGAAFNYGESDMKDGKETSINNVKVFGNVRKTLTERTFGYLDANFFHDDVAKVSYRFTVGPGGGVYVLKQETTTWSFEVGPAYLWEKVAGEQRDYLTLRVGDRFEWKFSGTAKCWQSAEYLARVDDVESYLLNAEVGVEAAMTTRLSLRLVLQNSYNSRPAADRKHNDLSLIAGVGVKL